jgi:predicted dehydrogenase
MNALTAGKHIFVEKPFADTTGRAREMVDTAESLGLVNMVGHTFLYAPPVITIKEIVRSGELGDIRFITSNR